MSLIDGFDARPAGAPIDVALLTDTLGRGGAERVLVDIANELDRDAYRVHVITTRRAGDRASELAADVEVHSLDRRTRLDLAALRRLVSILTDTGIRLVHSHSHTAAYFMRVAETLAGRSWPHVVHDHHGPVVDSPTLRLLDRIFLRSAGHWFAVSEPLARYARERVGIPAWRCEVLPNGVAPIPTSPTDRERRFTVVQVARLEEVKDQMMALDVAAGLRDRLTDFRWWFVGRASTDYALRCRRRVRELGLEDRVSFLGERSDVGDLLGRAHVGVLTSRREGLPLSLLEYMAAGLPVVATEVGQCGRLIDAAGGGVAVSPGDPSAFADALASLFRDAGAARRAGEANRRYVTDRFSVEAMTRRVEAVYADLLDRPPAPDRRGAAAARGEAAPGPPPSHIVPREGVGTGRGWAGPHGPETDSMPHRCETAEPSAPAREAGA